MSKRIVDEPLLVWGDGLPERTGGWIRPEMGLHFLLCLPLPEEEPRLFDPELLEPEMYEGKIEYEE